ncbi:hypothetical protein D3C81_605970 [compost metagenome]
MDTRTAIIAGFIAGAASANAVIGIGSKSPCLEISWLEQPQQVLGEKVLKQSFCLHFPYTFLAIIHSSMISCCLAKPLTSKLSCIFYPPY